MVGLEYHLAPRARKAAAALFGLLLCVYLLTSGGHFYAVDEEMMFTVLVSEPHPFSDSACIDASREVPERDAAWMETFAQSAHRDMALASLGIGTKRQATPALLANLGRDAISASEIWEPPEGDASVVMRVRM